MLRILFLKTLLQLIEDINIVRCLNFNKNFHYSKWICLCIIIDHSTNNPRFLRYKLDIERRQTNGIENVLVTNDKFLLLFNESRYFFLVKKERKKISIFIFCNLLEANASANFCFAHSWSCTLNDSSSLNNSIGLFILNPKNYIFLKQLIVNARSKITQPRAQ